MRLGLCICMCATEGMIQSQDEPERMRAFLLVAVFFDQLMDSRFHSLYENFYEEFTVPRLLATGGCGCATPDWLLNHEHGFDENVDWLKLEELASGAFVEIFHWIRMRHKLERKEFSAMVSNEIAAVFEREHRDKLQRAFLQPS